MIKLTAILESVLSEKHAQSVEKSLSNKAKATGISKTTLRQVYDKGLAAWKTGHRPGVSQHQWAMARVNSFVTGKGKARQADKTLWKKRKKIKKK